MSTGVLGLLYFVHQFMAKNFLELRPHSSLDVKREAVLVTFVFLTSLLLSCNGGKCVKSVSASSNNSSDRTRRNHRK